MTRTNCLPELIFTSCILMMETENLLQALYSLTGNYIDCFEITEGFKEVKINFEKQEFLRFASSTLVLCGYKHDCFYSEMKNQKQSLVP